MNNKCILFAGNASQTLGKRIARSDFDIHYGNIENKQFPSGEWYCQLNENVRGADVFILNTTSTPANDSLMQLLIMMDAARRACANHITAILPYYGYSRQDRKDKPRVPISAKLVMDLLQASGAHQVLTMDLHAAQIGGFTNLPFDNLYFRPLLIDAIKNLGIEVVVAPDIGADKRAEEYAERLNVDIAIVSKKRKNETTVKTKQFIGDVAGKKVLMVDDLTESLGTHCQAAIACKQNGAIEVNAAVTHCCLTDIGIKRLEEALTSGIIDRFFYSTTVETIDRSKFSAPAQSKLIEIDVAPLFAKAIYCIHNNESISSLFK